MCLTRNTREFLSKEAKQLHNDMTVSKDFSSKMDTRSKSTKIDLTGWHQENGSANGVQAESVGHIAHWRRHKVQLEA